MENHRPGRRLVMPGISTLFSLSGARMTTVPSVSATAMLRYSTLSASTRSRKRSKTFGLPSSATIRALGANFRQLRENWASSAPISTMVGGAINRTIATNACSSRCVTSVRLGSCLSLRRDSCAKACAASIKSAYSTLRIGPPDGRALSTGADGGDAYHVGEPVVAGKSWPPGGKPPGGRSVTPSGTRRRRSARRLAS